MEVITISGILIEDCTRHTDKKEHQYIRFKVGCEGYDSSGKKRITTYRCYCYNMAFDNLKKGDCVFLTGPFSTSVYNSKVYYDIFVQQIAIGHLMKRNNEETK